MKRIRTILITLILILSLTSCGTMIYTTTQDDIYTETRDDIVYSTVSFNTVVQYGRPYYYNGTILYYFYDNIYYYPFFYNNYWYVRAYRRPFNHLRYRPYFRPHKYDYKFKPRYYSRFRKSFGTTGAFRTTPKIGRNTRRSNESFGNRSQSSGQRFRRGR